MQLIDTVQRLGVGYLFEREVEEALEDLFINVDEDNNTVNLYHTTLRFRLLRQQGLPVSLDVFMKLKDSEGRFKEWLSSDEQGLLSLYEAAHVALNGEDILDEILSFATRTLKRVLVTHNKTTNHSISKKQIEFSLRFPIWKCIPRLMTRNYIDLYSEDPSHDPKLLTFAKLDFNRVQKFHQQELHEITKWWSIVQVATNFPYARDRVVECYFGMTAIYFEPKYRRARMILSKICLTMILVDDTYDNYATYEELQILTKAIERLEIEALETLPDTMKDIYHIILNTYEEIKMELGKIGCSFGAEYAKAELKRMCRSFLVEARWRTEGYVPTVEEYKTTAYITSSSLIVPTYAFLGMGTEIVTRDALKWLTNEPKMLRAIGAITRLHNDIVSYEMERKREHVASAVDCYMKEHVKSQEEATEIIWKEISEAWKDITKMHQKPTPLPAALIERLLNYARFYHVLYEHGDAYTHPQLMKAQVASLFVNPVPL
ncbi:unnamed protein product [Linum tenue]|uniref:Uncharacterized protein n=3 Tax=Linum tenue TaxID=586396 RepID=A0AAV0N7Y3_9ROSI|nr:unnamed protein product [Linum tenue]